MVLIAPVPDHFSSFTFGTATFYDTVDLRSNPVRPTTKYVLVSLIFLKFGFSHTLDCASSRTLI